MVTSHQCRRTPRERTAMRPSMNARTTVRRSHRGFVALTAVIAVALVLVSAGRAQAACTPGKTGRIAFLLKQQTAFRYLHADVPFFQKTVEAAGFKVVFQSAENDPNTQVSQAE